MLLRIFGVATVLFLALAGLSASHIKAELHRFRDDVHRLRHHLPGPFGDQPGYNAYTFPASSIDRVVVNTSKVQRIIPGDFFGINYVGFWDTAQGSRASARALAQTPIRTVRFPGGAPADWYDWQDPYYKGWSSTSPKQLWTYARSFGAHHVRFGTNVQGNIPSPPGHPYAVNSPENAAAWTRYNKKSRIIADMEVGNEEDLKLLQKKDDPKYVQYIDAFIAQAKAMHQADPAVHVLGPVGVNEWYWWALDGLGMFLQRTGNRTGTGAVDGISLHFYKGTNWFDARGAAQYWLSKDGPWTAIQNIIHEHDSRKLPVYITEWNLGASDFGNAFTPTLGHALATADMVGALAASGVAGEDYFTMHGASGWGLLYGVGEKRPVDTPTPTYYSMALWKYMGSHIVALQQSDDPANVVSAYATTGIGKSVQVLLINKRPAARTVRVGFQRQTPSGHHLRVYSLRGTAGSVDDLDAVYNGVMTPSAQKRLPAPKDLGIVHGSTVTYRLPAYSAVVLELDGVSRSAQSQWQPIPTATALPPLQIKLAGHPARSAVRAGETQSLVATVQGNDDVDGLMADFEVYDGSGAKVFQTMPTLKLTANRPKTITQKYKLPLSAYGGTYHYKVGVFGPGWKPIYAWVDGGSFDVTGPPRPEFSIAASAAPSRVKAGETATITAIVRATRNGLPNALVDFEVYSDSGAKICQVVKDSINVPKDGAAIVVGQCTVPKTQASGQASVRIGVFGPGWIPNYVWNSELSSFQIAAAS